MAAATFCAVLCMCCFVCSAGRGGGGEGGYQGKGGWYTTSRQAHGTAVVVEEVNAREGQSKQVDHLP